MRRRERGSIFVVSLAVLAGLIAILGSVAATHRIAVRAAANRMEMARAKVAAYSGLQQALAVLANQAANTSTTAGTSSNSANVTTLNDDWATAGSNGDVLYRVGNTQFRLEIIDALSKININTAPQAQLQRMNLTDEQIDSLLDFREAGETERPLGGKDAFYNNLPHPYNAALRSLDTIDELLLVKGFTAQDVYSPPVNQSSTGGSTSGIDSSLSLYDVIVTYGYSPQITATGAAKINVNAQGTTAQRLQQIGLPLATATQIAAQKNWTSVGQLCAQFGTTGPALNAILDNLVTNGASRSQGKLNLNTVTEQVLNSLPQLTPDIVQGILSQQQQGFNTLSDITKVPGLNNGASLRTIADLFTVVSQTYIVRVAGQVGSITYAMEATVDLQNGTPTIIRITEAPFANMTDRWGWNTTTSSETVIKGNS